MSMVDPDERVVVEEWEREEARLQSPIVFGSGIQPPRSSKLCFII